MRNFVLITILFLLTIDCVSVEYHWEVKDADTSIHYGNIAGKSKTHIVTYSLNANRGGTFYFTDLNLENPKTIDIINPKDLYLFDACMTEDNRLFVVADSGYILTNTINDEGWHYTKIFDESEAITTIAFRDENYGCAANNGNELYSTSDGGTTWVVMPEQVDDFPANYLISRARFEGNTLFLIIYDFATKLYYTKMSFDSGTTWENAALIDNELFNPVDYYYDNGKWWLVGRKSTGVGHLQYSIIINSNDNGKTWSRQLYVDDGIRGGIFSIQFFDDSNEGLAVNPLKVYYTSDGGENWEILADTLSNPDSLRTLKGKLLKIDNEMYIIGYDRIIKFVRLPNSINENIFQNELFSIFPNPSSDFITIQFQTSEVLKTSEVYKVQIFDMLGIEIISESIHPMTASHRMNVEKLPAGVYFIRVGDKIGKFVKM